MLKNQALTLYSFPFKAMGSVCEAKLYVPSPNRMKDITALLTREVNRLEEKYTRYKVTSVTSEINAGAGKGHPVSIDHETAQLLHYADTLYQQSDGLFDITSGVLRNAWDFRSGQLPTPSALRQCLPLIGWQDVVLTQHSIQLPRQGMQIDFGGFVKEYTADVLSTLCQNNQVMHGLINLGGDIRVIGPHPNGSPWRVGIQHPRQGEQPIARVNVFSGGIATSGDYERYMVIDGVRYCHLLNPLTGQSIQPAFASVSVIADSCLIAGSFSSIAILKSQLEKEWLAHIDLPYLTIDQTMTTSGPLTDNQAFL